MNSYCILAGGCFWCIAMPFYEKEGVNKVISGYAGGKEINPTYYEVKHQKTSHKECIKIVYDEGKVSFEQILKIYFEHIDPYDDGGQFIDRGESYTTCIFYNCLTMKEKVLNYISNFEEKYDKKVAVKVLPEEVFYMAEEYHQDYALKNPELMEKELIESGRKK
jgi:methionine-S-sulfoxide reductase